MIITRRHTVSQLVYGMDVISLHAGDLYTTYTIDHDGDSMFHQVDILNSTKDYCGG